MAVRPITDTLRHLRGGVFIDEASTALAQLVERVSETGKSGELTITIKLKKASMGAGALIVSDKIAVKLPKEQAVETIMFPTPENNLVTEDPRQAKLPLRALPDAIEAPKAVSVAQPAPIPVAS